MGETPDTHRRQTAANTSVDGNSTGTSQAHAEQTASDTPTSQQPGSPSTALTWVGIGASAGGLEALRNFVRNLKCDLPATFIVAQHMAPLHRSMLAEIIGRETDMPVNDIVDGTEPVPDNIYITPPNNNLMVEGSLLRLIDPSPEPAAPKPSVDVFFKSLARNHGNRVVGIVLSGTGSDGAEGIRAVREHGGITCAQDEDSAKYASMPLAAVDTGCVDLVLSPDELGKRFPEVLANPRDLRRLRADPISHNSISTLIQLLLQRTKVNFQHYKVSTFQRRIERRMAACEVNNLEDYVAIARSDPHELDALFQDMLITVTSFFRDPDEFDNLKPYIKGIVDKKNGEGIRVWVAGAATGEEAYTLAIMFAEAAGGAAALDDLALQIFATDIDEKAIDIARRGYYAAAVLESVPTPLVSAYMDSAPGGYTVRKALREKIIFSVHNVAQDPPFLNVDMISCRNLLIYFQTPLQARVFSRFRYALVPHGLLFLGKSETMSGSEGQFRPAGNEKRIYIQRPLAVRKPLDDTIPAISSHQRRTPLPSAPSPDTHELAVANAQLESLVAALGPNALLISANMDIRRAYGNVSGYVGIEAGAPVSTSAMSLLREPFRSDVRAAVPAVVGGRPHSRSSAHPSPVNESNDTRVVAYGIDCGPDDERLALIIFEESERRTASLERAAGDSAEVLRDQINELNSELEIARTSLQQSVEELETSNEELQALNEEMQASNEELQSTNEEMETSNEELQSTNEELSTVNEELQVSSQQLNLVNHSLKNILDNVGIPMLVVDRALNITHISNAAKPVFSLAADLVLPHITRCGVPQGMPQLVEILAEAIEEGRRVDRQINLDDMNATLSAVPHYSTQGEIVGAIILLNDNTEQLKRTEQELQFIFDNVPLAIMVRNAQGEVIKANRTWANLMNEKPEDLSGRSFYSFFENEIGEQIRELDKQALTSNEGASSVVQRIEFAHQPGNAQWARMALTLADYPGVNDPVLYSVTQDVTTQREIELALEISEMRLDAAIDAANVGLWDWNPHTNQLYWSHRFMEMVGLEASAFNGSGEEFFSRVHPEDSERVASTLQRHIDHGEPYDLGYRLRHKSGRYLWMEAHGKAKRDENGAVERVIGTVQDVTENRQNVYALLERNRQLDQAQHISGVGYWKIDLSANTLFWSAQIYEIHGVNPDDYEPDLDSGVSFYHPDDRPMVEAHVNKVLQNESQLDFEARLIRPDGEVRTVQSFGQSQVDGNGEVQSVFGVFRDITEQRERESDLKRTLQELSRSNEELSRFSYVCSHDMKEPVRMIESMSELLLDPDISRDDSQRRQLILRISQNMSRLKGTIDSLLAYSRLEAKVEQIAVDMNVVTNDVVDNLQPVIDEKKATIELSELPVVRGAKVHFQQLFQNLIGNALKYSNTSPPRIRISGHSDDTQHYLTIEDNGPGIPEESMHDIFTVFRRLTLHSEVEGTGLGLSICHRIVTQYGGTIGCRASELGGAAFDITLPVDVDEA